MRDFLRIDGIIFNADQLNAIRTNRYISKLALKFLVTSENNLIEYFLCKKKIILYLPAGNISFMVALVCCIRVYVGRVTSDT